MSKKRKANNEDIKFENTSLYKKAARDGDLTAEEIKLKKRKKHIKIGIVLVSIIVLLAIVPWIVVGIITAPNYDIINTGETTRTYQSMLENVKATAHSTELFNMKNPDLNNTDAVTTLISKLNLEEELGTYTVSVQASEKPYTVTLKFDKPHDMTLSEDGNKWETEVIKYSTAIMGLIDNIAQVNWEYPIDGEKTDGKFFNRADAEKFMKLNVPIARFGESERSVQLLLNLLGIDLY